MQPWRPTTRPWRPASRPWRTSPLSKPSARRIDRPELDRRKRKANEDAVRTFMHILVAGWWVWMPESVTNSFGNWAELGAVNGREFFSWSTIYILAGALTTGGKCEVDSLNHAFSKTLPQIFINPLILVYKHSYIEVLCSEFSYRFLTLGLIFGLILFVVNQTFCRIVFLSICRWV